MFWRVPSYSQASPLEGILDKQNFTIEELLDEEDLIQVNRMQPVIEALDRNSKLMTASMRTTARCETPAMPARLMQSITKIRFMSSTSLPSCSTESMPVKYHPILHQLTQLQRF